MGGIRLPAVERARHSSGARPCGTVVRHLATDAGSATDGTHPARAGRAAGRYCSAGAAVGDASVLGAKA